MTPATRISAVDPPRRTTGAVHSLQTAPPTPTSGARASSASPASTRSIGAVQSLQRLLRPLRLPVLGRLLRRLLRVVRVERHLVRFTWIRWCRAESADCSRCDWSITCECWFAAASFSTEDAVSGELPSIGGAVMRVAVRLHLRPRESLCSSCRLTSGCATQGPWHMTC